MYLRCLIMLWLVTLLASCGSGSVSEPPPTLTLLSSIPLSGSIAIPVTITNLEIRVEEALNPASINNETVRLKLDPNQSNVGANGSPHDFSSPAEIIDPTIPVQGEVWFDPQTKTIHFHPRKPLHQCYKTDYLMIQFLCLICCIPRILSS